MCISGNPEGTLSQTDAYPVLSPPAIPCIPPAQEYRNVRTASTHRGRHFYPAYIRNEKVPVIPGASPVLLRR